MRILTVSHFFDSHGGGIERVAGNLCRKFAQLGATSAWAASDADSLSAGDVEAIRLKCINPTEKLIGLPMPIPRLRGIRTLAREVRRTDALVIHDALYATSILAMLMAKLFSKRVVLIQHISTIPFSSIILRLIMSAANFLVTRPMLWAADERVFISDTVRRDLLGSPPRKFGELLFNGVDPTIFYSSEGGISRPSSLLAMEASTGRRRLLFVGRYVDKKGLSVLHALAQLRQDIIFVLVGKGPIRPNDWGLPNIRDLGPQTPQAVADLYRWADLLFLPSVGEGYPLVIQEAMACGLPVVCGEPSDRADPGATRWLRGVRIDLARPAESAQRCSEAMDGFSLSALERAEMASYARVRYDWGIMAEALIALARGPRLKLLA